MLPVPVWLQIVVGLVVAVIIVASWIRLSANKRETKLHILDDEPMDPAARLKSR